MSTPSKRTVKLVLYVAETKDWREWEVLTRIRPNISKLIVVDNLKSYKAQRTKQYSGGLRKKYRVVPYRQEPKGAEHV